MTSTALPHSFAAQSQRWSAERGGQPAVSSDGKTLTYRELDHLADGLAVWLLDQGVGPGDRVAYVGRNRIAFGVIMVAASKVRAIVTALNWRLAPRELGPVLGDAQPSVMFVAKEFYGVVVDALSDLERSIPLVALPDGPGHDAIADMVGERGDLAEVRIVAEPELDDIAMLTYTSGTTGVPKGVVIRNRSIAFHCAIEMPWETGPDSVLLISSPVFHAAGNGWMFLGIFNGAHMVLLPDADPKYIAEAVRTYPITDALLVPALLQLALANPEFVAAARETLRTVVYGASAITPKLLAQALARLPECNFVQGYGMTETIGPVSCLYPDEHRARGATLTSAGTPIPGVEVRIVDPVTLEDCEDGVVGEIWTRSGQNCSGYWRRPDATAEAFHDGWLRTGDAGRMHGRYLYVTDRIKDMINSGGENIYAGEVERVLADIDGVYDVCVVGVPHEKWGETVCAVVVRTPGATLTEDVVIEHARKMMAHYKCPSMVRFADELPRNPAGKVLRRAVRVQMLDAAR